MEETTHEVLVRAADPATPKKELQDIWDAWNGYFHHGVLARVMGANPNVPGDLLLTLAQQGVATVAQNTLWSWLCLDDPTLVCVFPLDQNWHFSWRRTFCDAPEFLASALLTRNKMKSLTSTTLWYDLLSAWGARADFSDDFRAVVQTEINRASRLSGR